jgi:peroxiredoxin
MRLAFLSMGLLAAVAGSSVDVSAGGLAIGDSLPTFSLVDVRTNRDVASADLKPPVVVIFIATQCPVSNAYNERMAALGREYSKAGVSFVAINANKQESAAEVAEHARTHGFDFPVLKDPGNVEADQFGAQVTPEAFVFDGSRHLVYHGRVDDSRDPGQVHSPDLQSAIDAVIEHQPVPVAVTKAFGCSIKRVS